MMIPFIVMRGIIGGLFTATEASMTVVVYAINLSMFYRRLSLRRFYQVMETSIRLFSLSLLCVAAASLWGWILAYYNVPQSVVTHLDAAGLLGSKFYIFAFVVQ